MTSWRTVKPGDVVGLRGKRQQSLKKVVTVVSLVDKNADGRGLVADDGETYRYFYVDVVGVAEIEGTPMRVRRRTKPSAPERVVKPVSPAVTEAPPVGAPIASPLVRPGEHTEWAVITPTGVPRTWSDGPWHARAVLKNGEFEPVTDEHGEPMRDERGEPVTRQVSPPPGPGSFVARRRVTIGEWVQIDAEPGDS